MNKTYSRINWINYPSDSTPINEENLNKIDSSLNEVDNRVIAMDVEKATKTEVATTIVGVDFDETTGIITFTRKNGTSFTIDTLLEKIAINFDYDALTQKLIIYLEDGTNKEIDLSALITEYEFVDTETVSFLVESDGKISAFVKDGSITPEKLNPDYLAQITVQAESANQSAQIAIEKAESAEASAEIASAKAQEASENARDIEFNSAYILQQVSVVQTNVQLVSEKAEEVSENTTFSYQQAGISYDQANISTSYAVGGTGTRDGEDTDNAKYYSEQANSAALQSANKASLAEMAAERAEAAAEKAEKETDFLNKDGDGKDVTVTFEESTERSNIESGEKLSVMFGKIKKFFADLKEVAFTGSAENVVDYNDSTNKISIGYRGEGLKADEFSSLAAYKGSSIKDVSVDTVKSKIGLSNYANKTSADDTNSLINSLPLGDSVPVDADYYVSQYVGGGTAFATYYRRPISLLWNYINSKGIQKLNNLYSSRPTSANLAVVGDGSIKTFKATSSMTEGKPPFDSHILHFEWDNTNGYSSQLALRDNTGQLYSRGMVAGTWTDWVEFANKSDITTLQSNFQAGVDTLYNKCAAVGSTPSSKTPTAIANAIEALGSTYGYWHGLMKFLNTDGKSAWGAYGVSKFYLLKKGSTITASMSRASNYKYLTTGFAPNNNLVVKDSTGYTEINLENYGYYIDTDVVSMTRDSDTAGTIKSTITGLKAGIALCTMGYRATTGDDQTNWHCPLWVVIVYE